MILGAGFWKPKHSINGTNSPHLVYSGWKAQVTGTGKTFLTSRVIDEIRPSHDGSGDYDGFAFFYCNHNEQNRIELKSILLTLLRQLSTVAARPSSMGDDLHVACQAADKQNSSLSLEVCKDQIEKSVNLYPQTVLVLDALDECESYTRRKLIQFFVELVNQCKKTLKVFISSRPDNEFRAKLPHLINFNLHHNGNKDDIKRFLNVKLDELESERDVFKQRRTVIINELLEKSGGMFQWVALQIDQISECLTLRAIQDRLSELPEGINAAYQEIYDNIERRQGKSGQEIAIRAFSWVMAACRPLTGQEILDAVSIEPDEDDIPIERALDKQALNTLCRKFLVVDSQGLWRFSHFSAVEYLRDKQQCNLGKAHLLAAKTCLIGLNSASQWEKDSDLESTSSVTRESFLGPTSEFSKYAGAFWMIHSKEAQDFDGIDFTKLTPYLEKFLGRPEESSPQYRQWFQELSTHSHQWEDADIHPYFQGNAFYCNWEERLSPQSCSAPAACYFSLFSVLKDWWEGVDLMSDHAWMCDFGLAQIAALVGCLPIYQWVSKKRGFLSSTAPDNYFNGSLTIACREGHLELVTWLVQNGVEANEECHFHNKMIPLTGAILNGNYDIVKYLIEQAKVDPNWKNEDDLNGFGTALVAASLMGHIEIGELLIIKGADVNMLLPNGTDGSALAAASAGGDIEVAELLINKGTDVNMLLPNGTKGSALAAASFRGEIQAMNLLINKGADVNLVLPGGEYGSALAVASYSGEIQVIDLLINKGADVNLLLPSGEYGSALAAASCSGAIQAVKLLIKKGANVNLLLPGGEYGSALAAASHPGSVDCVRTLLASGADVNMKLRNGTWIHALQAAVAEILLVA
ncbi:unnamed protein product [Penicillium olsonii]|nr:unnamed protein product [Penicillium olsonii]